MLSSLRVLDRSIAVVDENDHAAQGDNQGSCDDAPGDVAPSWATGAHLHRTHLVLCCAGGSPGHPDGTKAILFLTQNLPLDVRLNGLHVVHLDDAHTQAFCLL